MIHTELDFQSALKLFDEIHDASRLPRSGSLGLQFKDDGFARVRDADPDSGTDVLIGDWHEKLGWRIYDFLAERTASNMYMMDEGGLLLTARGLTPEEVGLELAIDRVPSLISTIEEDGSAYQWRPEPNPRAGTLT